MTRLSLYDFLNQHEIPFERYDHPPLYTCEDANRLTPELPGAKVKNLFLRDRKGNRHFLLVVSDRKHVNLKILAGLLDSSQMSLGSPERLKKYLGIEPGSVSLLALHNDEDHAVELVIDKEIWKQEELQCHPLVNTSTLVVKLTELKKFLELTGHKPNIIDLPR